MKISQAASIFFMLLLSISFFTASYSYSASESQNGTIHLLLVLRLRDYRTDMPISNTSITATIQTAWGKFHVGPVFTNESGVIQVSLGTVKNLTSLESPKLLELSLSNNYTLIKVQDVFMEDENVEYSAEYVKNYTNYERIEGVTLVLNNMANQSFVEGNLWVLKGKLVKISDCSPIAGRKEVLLLKPAVKAVIEEEEKQKSEYEDYYFFPLKYDVTIINKVRSIYEIAYSPLKVRVEDNTTLINWMYHAAKTYLNLKKSNISEDIRLFTSSGYSLDREIEELHAIENLLDRVLNLYQKREYAPALGGARICADRLEKMKLWLSNLSSYTLLTSIGVCLFTYGLASLTSSFIFTEPSNRKIRLAIKILIFSLLMLTFSLTHPALKITYAIFFGSITGTPINNIDQPTALLGCFIIGSITYFLVTLISIKKTSMTEIALKLGIRNVKRRRARSILTLITIMIIVSSSIVFVNISINRTTRIKESWKGTSISSVIMQSDITLSPLSEYDVNWTRMQNCTYNTLRHPFIR